MSQAKRTINMFQNGTGSTGIQSSKLKFKVDGNDYELDEKVLTDDFNPFFEDLKQKGYAKENNRQDWLNTYTKYLEQVKTGAYDIKSSGDSMLTNAYQGDKNALLGLDENNQPIVSHNLRDDNSRISYLQKRMGDNVVKSFNQDVLAKKAKADADKAENDLRIDGIEKGRFGAYSQATGETLYTKDWSASPQVVLTDWWNKTEPERLGLLNKSMTSKFKLLFDPYNFSKDDEFVKKFGMTREELRKNAEQYYDPLTNTLKGKSLGYDSFMSMSNFFDTMGQDAMLYNKDLAFPKSQEQLAVEKAALDQAEIDRLAAEKIDEQTQEAALRNRNGIIDGNFYNNGNLHSGQYVNKDDYYNESEFTGYWKFGKKVSPDEYNKWLTELEKDPVKNKTLLDQLDVTKTASGYFYRQNTDANAKEYRSLSEIPNNTRTSFMFDDIRKRLYKAAGTNDFYGLGDDVRTAQFSYMGDVDQFKRRKVYDQLTYRGDDGKLKNHRGRFRTDPKTKRFYMVDEKNVEIKDKKLNEILAKAKPKAKDATDFDDNYFLDYTPVDQPSLAQELATAMGSVAGIPLVLPKFVQGGIAKANTVKAKPVQATLRDVRSSVADNYQLSGMDKAELVGLGLDAASFITSLGGAGSIISGSVGLAGTLTQAGVDIARDGLDLGDAGRFVMNAGLDAMSFVPGVGTLTSAVKMGKTLKQLSKGALFAAKTGLIGMGAGKAAGILYDVATTDKEFSDLTIDEQRALVNGLQAVVGGTRMANNSLAITKGGNANILKTKKGPVNLTDVETSKINVAKDKVVAAKEVLKARGVADEDLDLTFINKRVGVKMPLKNGISPIKRRLTETVDLTTTNGTVLKNKDDYGKSENIGTNLKNKYMRWVIDKASIRNPELAPGNVNQQYSAFGDYSVKPKLIPGDVTPLPESHRIGDVIPKSRRLGPATNIKAERKYYVGEQVPRKDITDNTGDLLIDNRRRDNLSLLSDKTKIIEANKVAALSSKKVTIKKQAPLKETKKLKAPVKNKSKKRSELITKVASRKDGGLIPMLQKGRTIMPVDLINMNSAYGLQTKNSTPLANYTPRNQSKTNPFAPVILDSDINSVDASIKDLEAEPLYKMQKHIINGSKLPQDGVRNRFGNLVSNAIGSNQFAPPPLDDSALVKTETAIKKFGESINPVSASELARALYTRKVNSMMDTRVERPLNTAVLQTPISVRGNFLAKNAHDRQASNLMATTRPTSSDSAVESAMRLEANTKASGIRLQGDMVNNQALETTRGQSLENDMRSAANRTDVANQNVDVLARATQTERLANNEKRLQMNIPLMDYWKQENYKKSVNQQYDRQTKDKIANLDAANAFELETKAIQEKFRLLDTELLNTKLDEPTRIKKTQERDAVLADFKKLQAESSRKLLFSQLGKYSDGGKLEEQRIKNTILAIKEQNKINVKLSSDNAKSINKDAALTSRNSQASMKSIQEMIKLALR